MDSGESLQALKESGALKKGHFKLSSGLHSDTYVQCALFLKEPRAAVEAGREIASRLGGKVDLVMSPALGGLLIGFTTALALGVDMVFGERVQGAMSLRRGFRIPAGASVFLVEDVITTGGSVLELAELVERGGAKVRAVGCIVDRKGPVELGYPVISLLELEAAAFPPEECPMCREGLPLEKPGSRHGLGSRHGP